MNPKLNEWWFMSSYDGGVTWQLTDGPFTEQEADMVKNSVDRPWVLIQIKSYEKGGEA